MAMSHKQALNSIGGVSWKLLEAVCKLAFFGPKPEWYRDVHSIPSFIPCIRLKYGELTPSDLYEALYLAPVEGIPFGEWFETTWKWVLQCAQHEDCFIMYRVTDGPCLYAAIRNFYGWYCTALSHGFVSTKDLKSNLDQMIADCLP